MRHISVGECLDALDKNGYPWTQGSFYRSDGSSCAMGQAFRNLGYEGEAINGALRDGVNKFTNHLSAISGQFRTIIGFNDNTAESYEDVVYFAHQTLDPYREVTIPFNDGIDNHE